MKLPPEHLKEMSARVGRLIDEVTAWLDCAERNLQVDPKIADRQRRKLEKRRAELAAADKLTNRLLKN